MYYENVQKNKRQTALIIILFMVMVYFITYAIASMFDIGNWAVVIAVGMSLISTFGSYWYSDKIVLASVGARKANTYEEQFFEETLNNLCIAAGLEYRPRFYIIDTPQMNAFATGRNEKNSVICLTTGLIETLERPEVEAVIAHELTHIINKDMLVTAIISVMAGMIIILADISQRAIFYGGAKSDNDSASGNAIIILVCVLLMIFAPIVTTFLRLLASRKREYMADAGAIGLTRNPDAMISALTKIHQNTSKMATANRGVEAQFIATPYVEKREFSGKSSIWSTHPTLEERVKAIRNLK